MKTKRREWATPFSAGLVALIFAGIASGRLPAATVPSATADLRRDAVVEAVQKVMPTVVNIATEEVVPMRDPLENLFREFFDPYYRRRSPNTQFSLGSGVIIDEEGIVLTNFHVVSRAKRVWVRLQDGREYECEKLTGNSDTDVALLRILAPREEKFAAIRFAGDDDLLLGETVLALGNPFGLGGSVARGILSSKSRRPPMENEPLDVPDWLQTDAAINPGNSGGPLVNLKGELIGINVAILSQANNIGFAVPVKLVAAMIAEIYSPEWLSSYWFGARVRPGAAALVVISVQPDSPAGKAGVRASDVILSVNGRAPRGFVDFTRQLIEAKDRSEIKLVVQRGAARQNLSLRLVPEKTFFNSELVRRKLGAAVQNVTAEFARALGGVEGVVIGEVDTGSPAARANLEPGVVITSVDRQATPSVVQLAKTLHSKPKGARVRLEVVVPYRRGAFLRLTQAAVELTVR